MKYSTIVFDANKPALNEITVPLNSQYGVALAVKKDGTIIYPSEGFITIDSEAGFDMLNDWTQFQFESGDVPRIYKKKVVAHKENTAKLDTDGWTATGTNTMPFPQSINIDRPLSDFYSGSATTIEAEWVRTWNYEFTDTTTGEIVPFVPANLVIYDTSTSAIERYHPTYRQWMGADGLHDSIDLTQTQVLRAQISVPASHTYSVKINVLVDSADGLDATFPLQIEETDLGYIERN